MTGTRSGWEFTCCSGWKSIGEAFGIVTTRVSATAPIVTPSSTARKDSRGESILRPPDGSVMKRRNLGNSVKIVANTIKKAAEIQAQRHIAPSWRLERDSSTLVSSSEHAVRVLLEKSSSSMSLDMNV